MRRSVLLTAFLTGLSGPLAAQSYPVKMEFDVRIPMKDGITLSADVYRPDAPGPFPVLVIRTPLRQRERRLYPSRPVVGFTRVRVRRAGCARPG